MISRQIAEASQFVQEQEKSILKIEQKIARTALPPIDKEKFKATVNAWPTKLNAGDVFQKDLIASNFVFETLF